jgi:NCS1 family nucleobase:cation symporter-1
MSVTTTAEAPQRIEDNTIQPIPASERHGKSRDLFTIWFGSNIMLLTVVNGALATTVYGQPFWLAVLGLVIGNLVGAVFMALHSAQGPRLGVPQMMQTRGQFGSYGSLLVIVLVVLMYVGFFASNLVLAGQSLNVISSHVSVDAGIVVVGAVSMVVTIFGRGAAADVHLDRRRPSPGPQFRHHREGQHHRLHGDDHDRRPVADRVRALCL